MSKNKSTHIAITFVTMLAIQGALAANTTPAAKPVISDYTRPISFEPNRGQVDKQVDFLARGSGYRLFLSHAEAVMVLDRGVTVRMRPVGSKPSLNAEPLDEQLSKTNYFLGNAPEKWHTGLPNYARVRYRDVYPGVDLIYYGSQHRLEYDFVVSPGADPDNILLDFQGATKATIDRSGNLVMHTNTGDLRWQKPVAYQQSNGTRKLVVCAYVRKAEQELGLKLDAYDRAKPLIIDPVLEYSTYLGGSFAEDGGSAIAVDANGNAYVTGFTYSTDFPTKSAFQPFYPGSLFPMNSRVGFVTKFDSAGKLIYSTYLGGSASPSLDVDTVGDTGYGIAVDKLGYVYVTGGTESIDFPIMNAVQSENKSCTVNFAFDACQNAFVTKLGTAGDTLVFSTYLGGSNATGDQGRGIALDTHASVYVTGLATSSDFPTRNAFQRALKDSQNAFLTKFDAAGTALVYSTYLGGSGGDQGNGIAVDANGDAYVTGSTASLDFPTKNAFQNENKSCGAPVPYSGCQNAFVTKFDVDGDSLVYSTYLGGSGRRCGPQCGGTGDAANAIAVDGYGHAYVVGNVTSLDFPTRNAFQEVLKGSCYLCGNAFLTKFDAAGSGLFYSTYLGGGGDQGNAIAVDSGDHPFITGRTTSPNFPTQNAFQAQLKSAGGNAFVTKFHYDGVSLFYSSYLGGSGGDSASGIGLDNIGNAYVAGETSSANFPIKNAFQNENKSCCGTAFVSKISAK